MDSVALVQGSKFISEQSRDSGNTHSRTQTPETHTRVRGDSGNTLAYAETPETHTRVRGDSGNTLAYARAALFSQEDRNDYFDK